MLNPMDISDRRFERAARGYRCEEVEAFLKDVALAYASLLKDNQECENKILKLVDKVNEYREEEDAIKAAILGAQRQANIITADAEMQAKKIMTDATEQSEKMAEQTKLQYQDELEKLNALKTEVSEFKAQLTELFNRQLRLIMEIPEVEEEADESAEETNFSESILSGGSAEEDKNDYYNISDYASAVTRDAPTSPYSAEAYFGKNFSEEPAKDTYSSGESRFGDLKFGNNFK